MKIITWNCNMAFRKKADIILASNPDILVVPECEHPEKLKFDRNIPEPADSLWFGTNLNKGLGIFSYSHYRFRVLDNYNPAFRIVVPIAVTGGEIDFTLYAIWAYNPSDPDGTYIEQVWKAIDYYENQLNHNHTILIGDFNSNTIWDRRHRVSNHSSVVARLEGKGIVSSYHTHHQQEQGKEKDATLYLYRHQDKPYHLDYCFVSKDLADKISSVEIGDYASWKLYSDHVPLIVTFN